MRDGMITEEQCGENFAYILEDKTDFLITEYKMMHGQEADFLLKCVKMLYNGKTELYYDTKSCLPLAIQSGAEDTEGMLSVLGNILHEVRRVTENGFLSLLKLDISADKIWVDPATRKIRFVYLPVAERLHKDVVEFEEHLRGELKKTVEKRSDKDDKRFADFFQIIGRPGYSSEDSDVEKCGSVDETSTPYSLNRNEKVSSQRGDQTCTLVSLTAGSPIRLTVTKQEYVIGKSTEQADGVAGFSKMISRRHCKIVKRGSGYAVVDLNSSNGTYLNGMQLFPGREYPVKNGDIIRMARNMARPRVIVADTDESYVIPLQKKFAELFADKIDLEIITDKDYFNQLFSLSQHADILLVSDTLYNSGLKKHDIRHLMILSEHYEPGQTDELDICRLFKYTSVREIFNEITGRCKDTLYAEQDAGKETKIILITSASGGVGKTSVAFGLCRCLERNYKKTLYVNADRLQSFQWMLENGEPIRDASVYAGLSGNLGNVYRIVRHVIRKEGFSYLPPFKAALMSLGIPYRVFALLAEAARKEQEYDYIVIDADSVFDEEKAALMQLADKILIVTKQTEYAVKATNELIQNVNRNNSDKYIFLCNDFKKEEENALLLPTAAHRFTVSEYIEHLPAYEMKGSGLPVQTPGLQKAAFLIM